MTYPEHQNPSFFNINKPAWKIWRIRWRKRLSSWKGRQSHSRMSWRLPMNSMSRTPCNKRRHWESREKRRNQNQKIRRGMTVIITNPNKARTRINPSLRKWEQKRWSTNWRTPRTPSMRISCSSTTGWMGYDASGMNNTNWPRSSSSRICKYELSSLGSYPSPPPTLIKCCLARISV